MEIWSREFYRHSLLEPSYTITMVRAKIMPESFLLLLLALKLRIYKLRKTNKCIALIIGVKPRCQQVVDQEFTNYNSEGNGYQEAKTKLNSTSSFLLWDEDIFTNLIYPIQWRFSRKSISRTEVFCNADEYAIRLWMSWAFVFSIFRLSLPLTHTAIFLPNSKSDLKICITYSLSDSMARVYMVTTI